MLEHSLPLPLFIDYGKTEMSTKDEEGILLALQHHHGRVRLINLCEPALQKLVVVMGKPFPMLENLKLISLDPWYCSQLPETFTAQRLRHLALIQVGDVSAPGLPLLASITGLVTLSLRGISSPNDLPINYLVSRLSLMPLLELLCLEFDSELFVFRSSSPGNVKNDLAALQTQMAQLSKLDEFIFEGHCRYLEDLVSYIRTPILTCLTLSFFTRPSIPLPRLSEFLTAAEELRYPACSFTFSGPTEENPGVSIVIAGLEEFSPEDAPFRIRFLCRRIDTQVACAAQVSTAMAPMLSSVERLHLEYYATRWHKGLPPPIPHEAWYELLRPFSNVQKLQLDTAMIRKFSFALCPEDGPPAPEGILPKLSKLIRPHHARFEGMLDPFIAARQAAGQPISKRRCPPTPDSESEDHDDPWSWLASQLADDDEGSTELDSDPDFDFE